MQTTINYTQLDSIRELAYRGTISEDADRVYFTFCDKVDFGNTIVHFPKVYIVKNNIDQILQTMEDGSEAAYANLKRAMWVQNPYTGKFQN